MLTYTNLLIFLGIAFAIVCFLLIFKEEFKEKKAHFENHAIRKSVKNAFGITLLLSFMVAFLIFLLCGWTFLFDNPEKNGTFVYETEYITEGIVYDEKYSNGYTVFINGETFVCDEIGISSDIDNYKIMSSTYEWKNGFVRFMWDSVFQSEEVRYKLLIPEKYINDK